MNRKKALGESCIKSLRNNNNDHYLAGIKQKNKIFSKFSLMNELMGMEGSDVGDCGSEDRGVENKLMFKSAAAIVLIARIDSKEKVRGASTQLPVWCISRPLHASILKSSVKFPQSVMIWGAMSSVGVDPLCFWKTNITAPFTKKFLSTSCFLLLSSFLKMLISFYSRIWHLPTLPKAQKVG